MTELQELTEEVARLRQRITELESVVSENIGLLITGIGALHDRLLEVEDSAERFDEYEVPLGFTLTTAALNELAERLGKLEGGPAWRS